MAKGDNLEERLINFAVDIVHLTDKFPKTVAGRHIADQLLRSGTSPAANYAEARNAESPRDFVHKMRIALKETNESLVWLKIVERSHLYSGPDLQTALSECDELCRILNASIQTAKKRLRRR